MDITFSTAVPENDVIKIGFGDASASNLLQLCDDAELTSTRLRPVE